MVKMHHQFIHIVHYFFSKFREDLKKEATGHDVERRLEKEFPAWFRSQVSSVLIFFSYTSLLIFF
jgi:hypothetical protein